MAFPSTMVSNWVQHEFAQGHCWRCGLTVDHDVSGTLWSVEGAILLQEPTTIWTVCTAQ